jgi:hypothetical protein
MSNAPLSEELAALGFEQERADLDAAVAAFEEPAEKAPAAPKEAKWLLASCMQKAIRQGDAAAAQWAVDAMLPAERAYALHRMAVVAVEDVGVANLPLVRDFMLTGMRKAWFEERGSRRAALYFARAFAESPKDRSACDLPLLALGLPEQSVVNAVAAPIDALRSALFGEKVDLRAKTLALWSALGGKRIKGHGIPEEKHDPEAFLGLCRELGATPALLWTIDQAMKLQAEWHPVALGLLATQAAREGLALPDGWVDPALLGSPTEPAEPPIGSAPPARLGAPMFPGRTEGGFFLSGLDGHCREGRQAIDACLSRSRELRRSPWFDGLYGRASSERAGALLFAFEGGRVKDPVDYPSARRVFASSLARMARRQNLSEQLLRDAPAFMSSFLPALDESRRESLRAIAWARPAASAAPRP